MQYICTQTERYAHKQKHKPKTQAAAAAAAIHIHSYTYPENHRIDARVKALLSVCGLFARKFSMLIDFWIFNGFIWYVLSS